jgi:hypothetical protein
MQISPSNTAIGLTRGGSGTEPGSPDVGMRRLGRRNAGAIARAARDADAIYYGAITPNGAPALWRAPAGPPALVKVAGDGVAESGFYDPSKNAGLQRVAGCRTSPRAARKTYITIGTSRSGRSRPRPIRRRGAGSCARSARPSRTRSTAARRWRSPWTRSTAAGRLGAARSAGCSARAIATRPPAATRSTPTRATRTRGS